MLRILSSHCKIYNYLLNIQTRLIPAILYLQFTRKVRILATISVGMNIRFGQFSLINFRIVYWRHQIMFVLVESRTKVNLESDILLGCVSNVTTPPCLRTEHVGIFCRIINQQHGSIFRAIRVNKALLPINKI